MWYFVLIFRTFLHRCCHLGGHFFVSKILIISAEMNKDLLRNKLAFLGNELIELMMAAGINHIAKKGEELMHQGQYVKFLPLVLEGIIKVTIKQDEREMLLYYIKPFESCVMSLASCLQNEASRIHAHAYEDCTMLLLPSDKIREWSQLYPKLNVLFLQQYDQRYSSLINALHHVSFDKLEKRLYDYLKEKSEIEGTTIIKTSHREIAADLGTAREVVTRTVKKLELAELVRQHENYIEILLKR